MSNSFSSSRDVAGAKPRAFQPGKDWSPIWEALTQDTDVAVMICDPQGVIEFVSERGIEVYGFKCGESCLGRNLAEYLPPELVRERLLIARESMTSGRAVVIEGMTNGNLLHCTFRCIPGPTPAQARILVVSHLAGPADPLSAKTEPGVVRAQVHDPGDLGVLTDREMEILKLIGLGLSSAEIARRLDRSVKTVEWHRVALGDKLGVTNRVELARIAISKGLVGAENPKGSAPADKAG